MIQIIFLIKKYIKNYLDSKSPKKTRKRPKITQKKAKQDFLSALEAFPQGSKDREKFLRGFFFF